MCNHLHVEHWATGGMLFSPVYGPWDDYHFYATCRDCGETHCTDAGDWPDPATAKVEDEEYEEIPI